MRNKSADPFWLTKRGASLWLRVRRLFLEPLGLSREPQNDAPPSSRHGLRIGLLQPEPLKGEPYRTLAKVVPKLHDPGTRWAGAKPLRIAAVGSHKAASSREQPRRGIPVQMVKRRGRARSLVDREVQAQRDPWQHASTHRASRASLTTVRFPMRCYWQVSPHKSAQWDK